MVEVFLIVDDFLIFDAFQMEFNDLNSYFYLFAFKYLYYLMLIV